MLDAFLREKPIEIRNVEPWNPFAGEKGPPIKHMWIKAVGKLSDDVLVHQAVLAYASDMGLMGTSQKPHAVGWGSNNRPIHAASLDHAMWFHRPFRMDQWLLYDVTSPSASGARGLVSGRFFAQDGTLVASVTQEGLIRDRRG